MAPVRQMLDRIFAPKTVAVIGATERPGSVGRTLMANLLATSFGGEIYPINPKHPAIMGHKAYPNIGSVPVKVDLAVIVTPAETVPGIIQECVDAGVSSAIIISAGFKETGAAGIDLEERILTAARGHMRIIGPNCLGVMSPWTGLNATFAHGMALKGNIAFISQSGALCTAVLDWSLHQKIGFSAFVSIGSMIDVNWGDLLDYFNSDPATKSILLYMESIGDPHAFLSAAQKTTLKKPVVLLKAGRTEESAHAAVSHTGALAGSDEVFSAAMRCAGVMRVESIGDLFNLASVLSQQPLPKGPKLTIVTNAGGPGVIATDAVVLQGGKLTPLSKSMIQALNAILPPHWSHGNPVDILGDASPELYAKAIGIAAADPNAHGILVVLTPQEVTDPTRTAELLKPFMHLDKPIFASWMGADSVQKGKEILHHYKIPAIDFPDAAARVFAVLWQYTLDRIDFHEKPRSVAVKSDPAPVKKIISDAKKEKRTLLDEVESKRVLQAYGIPTTPIETALSAADAARIAKKMGFPVVLKVYSRTITHKSDVGGVKLNLKDPDAVKEAYQDIESSVKKLVGADHFLGVTVQPMETLEFAYQVIVGSNVDEQFGPVILFGAGGVLVELINDRALSLPPLTTILARKMMERTRIYKGFRQGRGHRPMDVKALEDILVHFSELITSHPEIKECDINPLLVAERGIIALDARIVLHD
jgi:acetyltransferase